MENIHKNWQNVEYIYLHGINSVALLKVRTYREVPLNRKERKELADLTFDSFNFKKHKEGYFTADDFILSDGRVLTDVLATPEKDLIIATSFTEESEEQEND